MRNTLSNLAARGAGVIAPLVLTPYIIHVLGLPVFGLWVVAGSVAAYLALLDLGVGVALTQMVAHQQADGGAEAASRLLVSSLAFYAVIAALTAALGWLAADVVAGWLAVPPDLRQLARLLFAGSAAVLAVTQLFSVAEAMLNGRQLMHVTAAVSVAAALLDIALTVAVLSRGLGALGLLAKDGLLAVLLGAARFAYLWRAQPGLSLHPRFVSPVTLSGLVSFGLRVQITRLAELTITQVDKLLLGRYVGLDVAGQYEIASRVVRVIKFLVLTIASALMPAAAALHAQRDGAALRALYRGALRLLVLVAAPAAAFTAAAAAPILALWVGPGYGAAAQLLTVLAVAHLAHTLTGPGTTMLRGIGRPGDETRYTVLLLATSVVFGVALIGNFGYRGALLATPAALVLSSLYFLRVLVRVDESTFAGTWRICAMPLAAATLAALTLWPGLTVFAEVATTGRLAALALLAAAAVTYGAVYTLLLWRGGYAPGEQRRLATLLRQPVLALGETRLWRRRM